MKKTPLLNPALSEVIASLGHGDSLVIADAGLPIPPETRRIDLALTKGIPGVLDTLQVVLQEMNVERAIIAAEAGEASPKMLAGIRALLADTQLETVTHERLKQMTRAARAVVRTGEFTPFANVILVSGVVF